MYFRCRRSCWTSLITSQIYIINSFISENLTVTLQKHFVFLREELKYLSERLSKQDEKLYFLNNDKTNKSIYGKLKSTYVTINQNNTLPKKSNSNENIAENDNNSSNNKSNDNSNNKEARTSAAEKILWTQHNIINECAKLRALRAFMLYVSLAPACLTCLRAWNAILEVNSWNCSRQTFQLKLSFLRIPEKFST